MKGSTLCTFTTSEAYPPDKLTEEKGRENFLLLELHVCIISLQRDQFPRGQSFDLMIFPYTQICRAIT